MKLNISKKLVAVGALLVGGYALAAAFNGPFAGIDTLVRYLKGGMYVGSQSTASTTHKVTKMLAATRIHDFPILYPSTSVSSEAVCANSSDLTITGCTFNDTLSVGIDQIKPAGKFVSITPIVTAANTVQIQLCNIGMSDAGTVDMPDASYTVRCTSNQ